jgi:protein-tyrosine phosphatase
MAPEIYWIPEVKMGRLGIMARPRAGEWLSDEVAAWCRAGVAAVVSLLESSEIRELGLHEELPLCSASNVEFISFPIPDRGVPQSVRKTIELVDRITSLLRSEAKVVIHCRAGIGRSSLVAGCVLVKLGFRAEEVFPLIQRARRVPVPDTPEQARWLTVFSREAEIAF